MLGLNLIFLEFYTRYEKAPVFDYIEAFFP